MGHKVLVFGLSVVCLVALVGVATPARAQTLEAKKVAAAPKLDGDVDAVWQEATPITVNVVGGVNLPGSSTRVTMRAVYTADRIYFLAQYPDATESLRRGPFQKKADGAWVQLVDPSDKGGDNNLYYEDKFAIIWAIKSPGFEQRGCMISCHAGEAGKPYGNKYLPAGETADMWHLKNVRSGPIGQVDDQYLDDTRWDKDKAPNAGRKSDAGSGGYADNKLINGKPEFARAGNRPAPPYWILANEKVAFDDSKYKAGDEVPSIVIAPFTGDRGDIPLAQKWQSGIWTYEFSRKLSTGSATDVQFTDASKKYAFGIAVFDNAQVRHAFAPSVSNMLLK